MIDDTSRQDGEQLAMPGFEPDIKDLETGQANMALYMEQRPDGTPTKKPIAPEVAAAIKTICRAGRHPTTPPSRNHKKAITRCSIPHGLFAQPGRCFIEMGADGKRAV